MNVLEDITMFVMVKYNGTCLSAKYDANKLIFKCKRGHDFVRTADEVINDMWCDVCTVEMDKFDDTQLLGIQNNCICLDDKIKNNYTKITWCCPLGHIWERDLNQISYYNLWCNVCKKLKKELDRKNKLISALKANNLKCIDEKQLTARAHDYIDIECDKGHTRSVVVRSLYRNDKYTCFTCYKYNRHTIIEMQEVAKQRFGKCLSTAYTRLSDPLEWECYYGHKWPAPPDKIIYANTWCPFCNISIGEEITRRIFKTLFDADFPKNKYDWLDGLELDGYNSQLGLAFEYNGAQHYEFIKRYHDTVDDLRAQQARDKKKNDLCKKYNITLITIPYTIKLTKLQEFIMDKCANNMINVPYKNEIDIRTFGDIYKLRDKQFAKFEEEVKRRGGEVIDDNPVYIDSTHMIKIQCKKKHQWHTSMSILVYKKQWCAKCNHESKLKYTIEDMNAMANKNNGKCLSEKYINIRTYLSWECNECGRNWDASPASILSGSWCGTRSCSHYKKNN